MDTLSAFMRGQASRGEEPMVFDWIKCANLIVAERPKVVSAGLAGDWEYTGGNIWREGKPVPLDETYVYLTSTWAQPEIDMDGYVQACYKKQGKTPGWDADTYWPPEAVKIMRDAGYLNQATPGKER